MAHSGDALKSVPAMFGIVRLSSGRLYIGQNGLQPVKFPRENLARLSSYDFYLPEEGPAATVVGAGVK